jgi:hypothetical protein
MTDASHLRSAVNYKIAAERGLGLGAGVLLGESDYTPKPSLIRGQNTHPTTPLESYFEDADELSALAARALDDDLGEAASDWNYSMPAADMNPQPPPEAITALERAARWRYREITCMFRF